MSLLRSLFDGLRSLFRKERVERELDEDLRGFLDMAAEENKLQYYSRQKDVAVSSSMYLERADFEPQQPSHTRPRCSPRKRIWPQGQKPA
jgi:hypothetical protein